jgi:hypothetical protein
MLAQHFARKFFNFAEGDGLKPTCPLQPEREAANPTEKIKNL